MYGLLVNYSLVSVKLSLFTWFPVAAWVLTIFPVFSKWRQSERLSYFYKDRTGGILILILYYHTVVVIYQDFDDMIKKRTNNHCIYNNKIMNNFQC